MRHSAADNRYDLSHKSIVHTPKLATKKRKIWQVKRKSVKRASKAYTLRPKRKSKQVWRPASLPLPLRVPGQGLACGAGCWLPEGVSDPAPLPLQYLLGHWFLSCSLPQIFISDLLLPLDFVDPPQTGVEECLDRLLHRLCCPPCLTLKE